MTPKRAWRFDFTRGSLINGSTVGIFGAARRDGGRSAGLTRRRSRAVRTTSLIAIAAFLALAFPLSAHADTHSDPAPDPVPPSLVAPTPPSITSPSTGSFLGSATATISGTKAAGSQVQVLAGTSRTNICTVESARTDWSCTVTRLPSGASVRLSAVQLLDGTENVESEPVRVDVLTEPSIAGTAPVLTSGLVQGAGYPNATITLSTGGGNSWSFPAGPDGAWAYVLPRSLGSGTFTATATQSTPFSQGNQSAPSRSLRILLDLDPPAAPTVTAPRAGDTVARTGTVFTGSAEDGATVEVFAVTASGADVPVCTAVASGTTWSCSGALPAGSATVTAFQRDAAGNVGAGSTPLGLRVGSKATPTPTPTPTRSPSVDDHEHPVPAPAVPTQPPTATPTPPSAPATPPVEPPSRSDVWANATPFTSVVPSAVAGDDLSWLRALMLAAVAILLLLVPARMLATTVAGRRGFSLPVALTGRNRVPTHDDPVPVLPTPGAIATVVLAVVTASGIVLFANPVHGQPEYLRVFLASIAALALLNLVASRVPGIVARRLSVDVHAALAPRLLLPVVAVALCSRLLDLQPALLFGVVCTVTVVSGTRASRGALALIRIGAVFVFGVIAWLASTMIGSPTGFAESLLVEIVNIAAMAGIGSAAVLLVPLGRLDGRALLVWSRPAWFAAAVVVLTVLFALLAPVVDVWENSPDALVGVLVAVGFGALGTAVWVWRRLVQPNLPPE